MSARRPRPRWWRDLAAVVVIGVVCVGAALVPAVTANSGGMITVRGDVREHGEPLPFFPVGFWVPGNGAGTGTVATATTDANGNFTMDVSQTIDGYAYAGTQPDSDHAVVSVGGHTVVRGIVGAKPAKPVSTPLYAGWDTATARGLGTVHFLLQAPGRIAGTSALTGSAVKALQVRRLDGSVVQRMTLGSGGRFTSGVLVPGDYAVALIPAAPLLPVVQRVTVASGATAAVKLARPVQGADVVGQVDVGDDADGAPAGVPVLLDQDGALIARTTTASGGGYRFAGVAAGAYTVLIGDDPGVDLGTGTGAAVVVPSASPTPTATASPTPSPTASTPAEAALEPLPDTTDLVIPASQAIVVPDTLGEVDVDTRVDPVGVVSGHVSGADGATTQVVVEDVATGRILRSTTADTDGAYTLRGLQPNQHYTVWAVTQPDDATLATMGSTSAFASTSTTGVDITLSRPALSVTGTISGSTAGQVTIGDDVFSRSAALDASGAYTVHGLIPGAFPVTDAVSGRLVSDPVALVLARTPVSTTLDLQPGPRAATFTGWFISAGAGVPLILGTATDADGDVVRLGPKSRSGVVTVTGQRPGTYSYDQDSFAGTVPAVDGPWWFAAPIGSFTLRDGAVLSTEPVVLHVRAR